MKRFTLGLKFWKLAALAGVCLFALGPSTTWAQEEEIKELDIFTVEATEAEGYKATNAISATRMSTSLLEIPQTINVLTADFLEDVNAFSPRDASRWVSNVHPRTNNHQPGVFIMRGQQHNLVYVDGYRAVQTERDTRAFFSNGSDQGAGLFDCRPG